MTPKAMPRAPSTSWARKPIATKSRCPFPFRLRTMAGKFVPVTLLLAQMLGGETSSVVLVSSSFAAPVACRRYPALSMRSTTACWRATRSSPSMTTRGHGQREFVAVFHGVTCFCGWLDLERCCLRIHRVPALQLPWKTNRPACLLSQYESVLQKTFHKRHPSFWHSVG